MAPRDDGEKISLDSKDLHEAAAEAHLAVLTDEVDTGAQLVAGAAAQVDQVEALRVRRKIDWHIMPLMCSEYPSFYSEVALSIRGYKRSTGCSIWTSSPLGTQQSWD